MKMTSKIKNRTHPKGFTLGRERFAKISAVEGIDLTGTIARELRLFDDAGLPAEARRAAVAAKFGRKAV